MALNTVESWASIMKSGRVMAVKGIILLGFVREQGI